MTGRLVSSRLRRHINAQPPAQNVSPHLHDALMTWRPEGSYSERQDGLPRGDAMPVTPLRPPSLAFAAALLTAATQEGRR
jgi:hypothetical protein